MKKRFGLIAALLAVTALVGCAKQPTEDEYKAWAEANGYVQNPNYEKWAGDNGDVKNPDYAGWAEANGYSKLEALPAARLAGKTGYVNGDSGVQINPTVEGQVALVELLGRPDVRYVDLRNENEGYLAGHIEGFETISYFQLIADTSAEKTGKQLFIETKHTAEDGTVTYSFEPRYKESEYILNQLFPKDEKALFLMCGGGVRVVNMMFLLKQYGYDMSLVYNVGGWNMISKVKGTANEVPTSLTTNIKGSVSYDFSSLKPYTAE